MLLKELKKQYIEHMKKSGIESAAFDFNYILQEVCGISAADMLTSPDMALNDTDQQKLTEILGRYIQGEPLQYILGYAWFMNNKFKVSPGVLIPRSDTEVVCEKAIEFLKSRENPCVLDMCCGSGCIGLSIADSCPTANVTLCDISPTAVEIAAENAHFTGVKSRVEILEGNLFGALKSKKESHNFSLIISNPPYISREIIKELDSRVRDYEPTLALDGGTDGLDFYRTIVSESPKHLANGGMLIFETGYDQTDSVAKLMRASCVYENIEIFKDYGGNFRGVSGIFKGDIL